MTQMAGDHLTKLVKELFAAEKCNQVVVLWACDFDMPDTEGIIKSDSIPENKVFNMVEDAQLQLSNKFKNRPKLYNNEYVNYHRLLTKLFLAAFSS